MRVVSDQRWLNKVFSVINRVNKLKGIQKSSLNIDLLDQGLLVHLELDPTDLIKLVQLVKAEVVDTGFC